MVVHNNALRLIAFSVIALMAKPATANEVSCLYDSNSEWPWTDSRVCQLVERPLLLDDEGHAICSDARADKDGDGWGWENNGSCIIDPNLPAKQSSAPALIVEQKDLVVFEQDFESASVGAYPAKVLNEQWHTPMWHMGIRENRASIVSDAEKGKALQVVFPANRYGSNGAVAFLNDLSFGSGVDRNFEELYVSYDVKFSKDFDFVRGGKLPGLCGYNLTRDPRDGCNTGGGFPTGYDGWSARGMWREDGKLENYVYHADQFYQYGDDEYWSASAERGKWHSFQHRIVLNTVGEANGIVEAWFDGVKVLSSDTMLFRKTEDIGINLFYFSTFYGGADPSWAPATDQFIYFDNFRIATTPLPETVAQKSTTPAGSVEIVESTLLDSATSSDVIAASDIESDSLQLQPAEYQEALPGDAQAKAVAGEFTSVNANQLPEIGAANATESGGGVFYLWTLALLLLVRRKPVLQVQ